MARAGTAYVEFEGDFGKLNRELSRKMAEMDRLNVNINVGLDKGDVARVKAETKTLGGDEHVTVHVNYDRNQLRGLNRDLKAASGGIGGFNNALVGLAGALLGPISAMTGLAVAATDVAGAAVALTAALSPLIGLLGALPGGLLGLGQIVGAVGIGFQGIGGAIKAGNTALNQNTRLTRSNVNAQRSAANQIRSATNSISTAHEGLAKAQENATLAQQRLTEAREAAKRDLEDLRIAAEKADEAQTGASLSLEEAQQRLSKAMSDPTTTSLELRRAQEDVAEAQTNVKDTAIQAKRATEDNNKAQKAGVEGSDKVKQARRDVADANRAVADALKQVAQSEQNLADAQEKARTGTADSTTALEKYHDALANLSPAQRDFVKLIVSLRPKFQELQQAIANEMLPGIAKGIGEAMQNFDVFKKGLADTGGVIGDLVEQAGKLIGSKAFGKDLASIMSSNNKAIESVGKGAIAFADGLTQVAVAAEPLVEWLGKVAENAGKAFDEWARGARKSGELKGFFEDTESVLTSLWNILSDVTVALANIFGAARGAGADDFLKAIERGADAFKVWTGSKEGQDRLKRFFEDTREPAKLIVQAIGSVGSFIFTLTQHQGGFDTVAKTFAGVVTSLKWMVDNIPGFGDILTGAFGAAILARLPVLSNVAALGDKTGKAAAKKFVAAAGPRIAASFAAEGAIGKLITPVAEKLGLTAGKRFGRGFVLGFILAIPFIASEIGKKLREKFDVLAPFSGGGTSGGWAQRQVTAWRNFGIVVGEGFVNGISSIFTAGLNALKDMVVGFFNSVSGQINAIIDKINSVAGFLHLPQLPTIPTISIPDIKPPKVDFGSVVLTAEQTAKKLKEAFKGGAKDVDATLRDMGLKGSKRADDLRRNIVHDFNQMAKDISTASGRASGALYSALLDMGKNADEVLKALGLKPPQIRLTKTQKQGAGAVSGTVGAQTGRYIHGSGSGDKYPIMTEAGEYVLNREAVKGIGKERLDALNFGKYPRFATGGIVPIPGMPGESISSSILNDVLFLIKKYKLLVTDGYAPTGHAPHGEHPLGLAIDVVPGAGGSWDLVDQLAHYAEPTQNHPISPWRWVGYDGDPGHGRGNHLHLSWLHDGAIPHISGGGAAFTQLRAAKFVAPDGILRDVLTGYEHNVRHSFNQYIRDRMGSSSSVEVEGQSGSDWHKKLEAIATAKNWSAHDWYLLISGESGTYGQIGSGSPTAKNPDSTAFGLGQLLDSTYGKYGGGPGSSAVQQIVAMANYISDRYGTPSAALSAWLSRSPHWYSLGGLIGMAGGGDPSKKTHIPTAGYVKQALRAIKKGIDKSGKTSAQRKIKNIVATANKLGVPADWTAQISDLSDKPGLYGTLAEAANTITDEDAITNAVQAQTDRLGRKLTPAELGAIILPMLGTTTGPDGTKGNQINWLTQKVVAIGTLRNKLIELAGKAVKQINDWTAAIAPAQAAHNSLTGAIHAAERERDNPNTKKERRAQLKKTIASLTARRTTADSILNPLKNQRQNFLYFLNGGGDFGDGVLPALRDQQGFPPGFAGSYQPGDKPLGGDAFKFYDPKGLAKSPPIPALGTFQGELFTAQDALKTASSFASFSVEPHDIPGEKELKDLIVDLTAAEARRQLIDTVGLTTTATFLRAPFGGSFEFGGVVPGQIGQPVMIMAHGGEVVTPVDQIAPTAVGETHIHISGKDAWLKDLIDTRVEYRTRQQSNRASRLLPGAGRTGRI